MSSVSHSPTGAAPTPTPTLQTATTTMVTPSSPPTVNSRTTDGRISPATSPSPRRTSSRLPASSPSSRFATMTTTTQTTPAVVVPLVIPPSTTTNDDASLSSMSSTAARRHRTLSPSPSRSPRLSSDDTFGGSSVRQPFSPPNAIGDSSNGKLGTPPPSASKNRTRPKPLPLHLDTTASASAARPSAFAFGRPPQLSSTPLAASNSAPSLLTGGGGGVSREEELRSAKRLTVRMSDEVDKDFLQGPLSVGESSMALAAATEAPATAAAQDQISPLASAGLLTAELDRLSLLGRTVRQNLQARPLPPASAGAADDPFSATSSASTPGGGLDDLVTDPAQLDYDPLNREIVRRVSLGARSASTSSLPGSAAALRGGLSLEPLIRQPKDLIDASELEDLLRADASGRPLKRRRLLIIDTRPLPAFLDAHLAHSAHVVMPSLLVKRCRRNGARQWTGGWPSLAGFISTDGGRRAWNDAFDRTGGDTWPGLDVVLVGDNQLDGKETESARVVETVARYLAARDPPSDVDVRWLEGGLPPLRHSGGRWDRWTREGEKSLETVSSVTSWHATKPMPQPILTPSPEEGHDLALMKQHASASLSDAVMLAPPPPPRTASVPSLRTAKRQPPRPMRIDTTGANQRSATFDVGAQQRLATAAGPATGRTILPKLNLDTGLAARNSNSNNRESPPPMTSVHLVAHAQSGLPPSPSSFGGVTRRVAPMAAASASASAMRIHTGLPQPSASSPWTSSENGMSSSGAQSVYPLLSPTEEPTASSFVVSTILPSFLFLGPEIVTESDVQQLVSLGVRRILNVAVECEAESHLRLRDRFEKYLQLPLRDCVDEANVISSVRQACAFLDDARLHSSPTYVHCRAGKSRSATVVLGYLIHANAWTFKRSYAYVSERRPGISPNLGFVSELYQFEASELGLKARSGLMQAQEDEEEEPLVAVNGVNNKAMALSQQQGPSATTSNAATHQSPRNVGMTTTSGASPRKQQQNKAYRESLPPMWSSSSTTQDESPTRDNDTPGSQMASNFSVPRPNRNERGIEREVRKNGQYVHTRKHPVDEQTLQPTRRASKAGLESLRNHLISPQLSPSLFDRKTISQTPSGGDRVGWL